MENIKFKTKKVNRMTRREIYEYCSFMRKYDILRSKMVIASSLRKLEKVVFGRAEGGAVVAIGTLAIKKLIVRDKRYVVIIPGAVFDPSARGKDLIRKYTIYNYILEKIKNPFASVVFCAVFGNWRGYRSFVGRLENAWPKPSAETPADVKLVMGQVFSEIYREKWDGQAFVVKNLGILLREAVTPISEDERDPYALEFKTINPGYSSGDGLATICMVSLLDILRVR